MRGSSGRADPMKVSVIIPCFDEAGSVREKILRARAACAGHEAEIVVVDDGSTDGTADAARALLPEFPELEVVSHRRRLGARAVLRSGLAVCSGDVVWVQGSGDSASPLDSAWIESLVQADADVVFRRDRISRIPEPRASHVPWSHRLLAHAAALRILLVSLLEGRTWVGPLAMALLGLALSVTLTVALGLPIPAVHDEFSYLLGADTFASGRVANPTHPMWMSLETFHTCVRPVYASMYPPAQSLFLAAGQVLSHPVIGVWLGVAALGAAACWALHGFLGGGWAVLGTSLLLFRLCTVDFGGVVGYWAYSYWGGAVAATGGALFLGGIHRVIRTWNGWHGWLAALGLGILLNSRPYEGLIMSLPGLVWFLAMAASRRNAPWRGLIARSLSPAILSLLVIGASMAYYNFRTTGDPLTLARSACHRQYSQTPSFLIGHERGPIPFTHRVFAQWNLIDRALWHEHRTLSGFAELTTTKAEDVWQFFFGDGLGLSLLFLPWILRERGLRFVAVTIGALLLGALPVAFSQVHYMAPIAVALYAVLASCARRASSVRLGGFGIGKWLLLAWLGLAFVRGATTFEHFRRDPAAWRNGFQYKREELLQSLTAMGGKHLVIVRYTDEHADFTGGLETVFNRASIDEAPVVFAREIADCPASLCGARQVRGSQNDALLRHFRDRKAWLYEADGYSLIPYPDSRGASDAAH